MGYEQHMFLSRYWAIVHIDVGIGRVREVVEGRLRPEEFSGPIGGEVDRELDGTSRHGDRGICVVKPLDEDYNHQSYRQSSTGPELRENVGGVLLAGAAFRPLRGARPHVDPAIDWPLVVGARVNCGRNVGFGKTVHRLERQWAK
ncbi:hypothetical protein LIA77_04038 [Sarocladium implicatum]|nr:hypothetical protein LIA77_04038 [Sarocladium implicatum]